MRAAAAAAAAAATAAAAAVVAPPVLAPPVLVAAPVTVLAAARISLKACGCSSGMREEAEKKLSAIGSAIALTPSFLDVMPCAACRVAEAFAAP